MEIPINNCEGCRKRDRLNGILATEVDRLRSLLESTNIVIENEASNLRAHCAKAVREHKSKPLDFHVGPSVGMWSGQKE